MADKVFIIAEAGVNHNGSIKTAKQLIDAAVWAGADAVKFQTFKAQALASRYALKARYQIAGGKRRQTQFGMLKKLELDRVAHEELIRHCKRKKIMFLCSAFDLESIGLLNELGLEIFKIPSGEITNKPYLKKIGILGKKVIMSTGMADLDEVGEALDTLVLAGARREDIVVLHCTTEYPTPLEDVNLKAMLTIKETYGVRVGYSDHTLGITVPIAAVALGAEVLEKHFTLDRKQRGPDHKASLQPEELKEMVEAVRDVEKALGNGLKTATKAEQENKKVVRKSIVAKIDIPKGTRITEAMLDIKRPGTGISPLLLYNVIGQKARQHIPKDAVITKGCLL